LNDAWKQTQMVNLVSVRQIDAINAVMKLQSLGVTEGDILNIYRFLEGARQGMLEEYGLKEELSNKAKDRQYCWSMVEHTPLPQKYLQRHFALGFLILRVRNMGIL
jgi:hypothetical protein